MRRILATLMTLVLTAGPASAQSTPRSCLALDNLVAQMNRSGGTETVQAIRGIFVETGLAFGGTQTSAKCGEALRLVRQLQSGRPAVAEPPRRVPSFDREALRFASASGSGPGFGGGEVRHWDHNGSRMALETGPGDRIRIWYWDPRSGLQRIGLRRGVLLFDGRRRGDAISGTARIFKAGCGAYLYPVSGSYSSRGNRVLMTGTRPVVESNCRVTGSAPDELIFTLAGVAPPGVIVSVPRPSQPDPVEEDEFDTPGVGVWAAQWRTHRLPAGDTLNVRAGPGTSHRVVGELPNGATGVLVIGDGCRPNPEARFFDSLTDDGKAIVVQTSWCRIEWNGLRGWVYAKYLRPM